MTRKKKNDVRSINKEYEVRRELVSVLLPQSIVHALSLKKKRDSSIVDLHDGILWPQFPESCAISFFYASLHSAHPHVV